MTTYTTTTPALFICADYTPVTHVTNTLKLVATIDQLAQLLPLLTAVPELDDDRPEIHWAGAIWFKKRRQYTPFAIRSYALPAMFTRLQQVTWLITAGNENDVRAVKGLLTELLAASGPGEVSHD